MATPELRRGHGLVLPSVLLVSLNTLMTVLLALVCLYQLGQASSYNSAALQKFTILFLSASGVSSLLFVLTIRNSLKQDTDSANYPALIAFLVGILIMVAGSITYSFVVALQFIA